MGEQKDSKLSPKEEIARLKDKIEKYQNRKEHYRKKLDERDQIIYMNRQKISDFELELEKQNKKLTAYKAALEEIKKKTGAYVLFIHALIIMVAWVSIPILGVAFFKLSLLTSFLIGGGVYITFVAINEIFLRDIRNV